MKILINDHLDSIECEGGSCVANSEAIWAAEKLIFAQKKVEYYKKIVNSKKIALKLFMRNSSLLIDVKGDPIATWELKEGLVDNKKDRIFIVYAPEPIEV